MCDFDFDAGFNSDSDVGDTSGDGDLDVSDTQDGCPLDEEIESLDESDIGSSILEDSEMADVQVDDELDDGVYHATKMAEEEVRRIDELWDETAKGEIDREPYRASHLFDVEQEEIREPYKAIKPLDDSGIDEEKMEESDVSSIDVPASLEEQFAAEVDAMSFDDLSAEQARLDSLSQMADMDIFAEYDEAQKVGYDSKLFAELTDGLPRETLEYLKEGLASGDPDVYDYFGLSDDNGDDNNGEQIRSRKR